MTKERNDVAFWTQGVQTVLQGAPRAVREVTRGERVMTGVRDASAGVRAGLTITL